MVEKSLSSKWNRLFLFHLLEESIASLTTKKTNAGSFFIPTDSNLLLLCGSSPPRQEFRDGPTIC